MIVKKIYRSVYDRYFRWADLTILGYLNRRLELLFSGKSQISDISLVDTNKYYRKNINFNQNGEERNILVECNHSEIATFVHNNYNHWVLSKNTKFNVIGFSYYKEPQLEKLYNFMGVKEFVYIYKLLNFRLFVKALYIALICLVKDKDRNNENNIKVVVDGIDIGDLIYDEFLRKEKVATYGKKDFLYFLHIYRGITYYLRFKEILMDYKITDIITSHPVYIAGGGFLKAAAIVNPEIHIWVSYPTDEFSMSRISAKDCINNIPQNTRFEKSAFEKIKTSLSDEELTLLTKLDSEYIAIYDDYYTGVESNNRDIISSEEDFDKYFQQDKMLKNIFIIPHVLIDGVKACQDNIYKDHFVWLHDTVATLLKNKNINIFIQAHPSDVKYTYTPKTKEVVEGLIEELGEERVFFVDKKISKKVLYEKAYCFITVCGSIGMEAPCVGIPVVVTSRPRYDPNSLKTVINATSKEEYKKILLDIHNIKRVNHEAVERAKFFILYFRYFTRVPFDFSMKELMNKNMSVKEKFNTLNTYFTNLDDIDKTAMYQSYKMMIDEDFKSLVNCQKIRQC